MPMVVKTNGNRVPYDGEKIRTGFMRALHKRPVPTEYVEQAVNRSSSAFSHSASARSQAA